MAVATKTLELGAVVYGKVGNICAMSTAPNSGLLGATMATTVKTVAVVGGVTILIVALIGGGIYLYTRKSNSKKVIEQADS